MSGMDGMKMYYEPTHRGLIYEWLGNKERGAEYMQFTGLLDKNKKEIYEGDIVEMRQKGLRYTGDDKSKYIVAWNEEQGCFGYKHEYGFVCRATGNVATISYFSNPTVIGNIYENGDLL